MGELHFRQTGTSRPKASMATIMSHRYTAGFIRFGVSLIKFSIY